jgi:hypothetical protein
MAIASMPHKLEDMPAPCTVGGENEDSLGYSKGWLGPCYGAVVGIRSWDRSVAAQSDVLRSAI